MRHLVFIAGLMAVLGACSSGSCDSGGGDKNAPAAEPKSLPGSGSRGGTGESVSFQGLGKKTAGDPPTPATPAAKAESALGGSGSNAPAGGAAGAAESVICGGFPYLTADCTADPVYQQVLKKCCPTGQVDRCQAIPGGARLTGRGCTAPAK
jgi:hypothetical protein